MLILKWKFLLLFLRCRFAVMFGFSDKRFCEYELLVIDKLHGRFKYYKKFGYKWMLVDDNVVDRLNYSVMSKYDFWEVL